MRPLLKYIIAATILAGCSGADNAWEQYCDFQFELQKKGLPCESIGDLDICFVSNGIYVDTEMLYTKFEEMLACAGIERDSYDHFVLKLVDGPIKKLETTYVTGQQAGVVILLSIWSGGKEFSFAHELGHYIEYRNQTRTIHHPLGLALNCGDVIDVAWELGIQDGYTPIPSSAPEGWGEPVLGEGFEYMEYAWEQMGGDAR